MFLRQLASNLKALNDDWVKRASSCPSPMSAIGAAKDMDRILVQVRNARPRHHHRELCIGPLPRIANGESAPVSHLGFSCEACRNPPMLTFYEKDLLLVAERHSSGHWQRPGSRSPRRRGREWLGSCVEDHRGMGAEARDWLPLHGRLRANNFNVNGFGKVEFSVDNAIRHLQSLEPKGKSAAAEYVWRAPAFIDTPYVGHFRGSHGFGRRKRHF